MTGLLGLRKRAGRAIAAILAASMVMSTNITAFAAGEELWQDAVIEDDLIEEAYEEASNAEDEVVEDVEEAEESDDTADDTPANQVSANSASENKAGEVSETEEATLDGDIRQGVSENAIKKTVSENNKEVEGNDNDIAAPTNAKAVINRKNQVKVTWKKTKGVKLYRVYRMKADGTSDMGANKENYIYEGKKPSFLDADTGAGTMAYKIMPYDPSLGLGHAEYVVATPVITSVQRTTEADNLIGMDVKFTTIRGADGYKFFRMDSKKGSPVEKKLVTPHNGSELEPYDGSGSLKVPAGAVYVDKITDDDGLVSNKFYYYKVQAAYDVAGVKTVYSKDSAVGSGRITTRAPKELIVSPNGGTSLYLRWEDMEEALDADGNKIVNANDYYQIYLKQDNKKYKKLSKIKVSSSKLESEKESYKETLTVSVNKTVTNAETGEVTTTVSEDTVIETTTKYYVGYELENLKPMSTYTVMVSVIKDKVEGSKSNSATAVTELSDIKNFKIKNTDVNTATLNWDEVDGATHYNVYVAELSRDKYLQSLTDPSVLSAKSLSYGAPIKVKVEGDEDGICEYIKKKLAHLHYYAFYVEPCYNKKVHDSEANNKRIYKSCMTRVAAPDVTVKQQTYNLTGNTLKLTWPKNKKATSYQVRYIIGKNTVSALDIESNTSEIKKATLNKNATSFPIEGVAMGQPVAIRITTMNESGGLTGDDAIGNSYEAVEYACPQKPEVSDVLYYQPDTGADLRLNHLTPASSTYVRGYQIWRSSKKTKDYELITEFTDVSDTQYRDGLYLRDGKKAFYRIYDVLKGTTANGSDPTWLAVSRDYKQVLYCNSTSVHNSDITVNVGETKDYTLKVKPAAATVDMVSDWVVADDNTETFTKGGEANDYIKITTSVYSSTASAYKSPNISIKGKKKGTSYIRVVLANGIISSIRVKVTEKGETKSSSEKKDKEDDSKDGSGITICLDPGHGGKDDGCSYGSLHEKELTLTISKKTKKYLEKAGFTVVMTRNDDTFVELEDRVKFAKEKGAKAIISQHINSGKGKGVECYYSVDGTGKSLASKMCSKTASATGMSNRGAKTKESSSNAGQDYYAIIRYARSSSDGGSIAGLIMENGFVQNDASFLDSDDELDTIAKANAEAIISYYGK